MPSPFDGLDWDGVVAHTEDAIVAGKGLLDFVKQRHKVEQEYAAKLAKLAASEKRARADYFASSGTLGKAWLASIEATSLSAQTHQKVAKKLEDDVVTAMDSFITDWDRRRKALIADGRKALSQYSTQLEATDKAKKRAHDASAEAERCRTELEKAMQSASPRRSELRDKHQAAMEAQARENAKYSERIKAATASHSVLHDQELPALLEKAHAWELGRLRLMKNRAVKFTDALTTVEREAGGWVTSAQAAAEAIDMDSDLQHVIKHLQSGATSAPPVFEPFDIEAAQKGGGRFLRSAARGVARVLKGDKADTGPAEPPASAVFNVPLAAVMAKAPGVNGVVPRVLEVLIAGVKERLAKEAVQGVFRVPGERAAVNQYQQMLDLGEWDCGNRIVGLDTHEVASCLKLWLRSLPEALVPADLYKDAVSAGNPAAAAAVLSRVPPLNLAVMKEIAMLVEWLLEPARVKSTLMNEDNLAMVFAPSIVRTPGENPHL